MVEAPKPTHVPVTMGAAGHTTLELDGLQIVHARFAPRATLQRHAHERPTCAVMLDGSFDLSFRGRDVACTPFTLFTEPGGESHTNHMGSAGAHVLAIQPEFGLDLFEPCRALLDGIHHMRDGAVSALARRLAAELRAPDDLTPLTVHGLALDLLASATRRLRGRDPESGPPAWLARVEERLRAEFRTPPTLADLARDVDRHPSHVARVFRERHRMSIGSFVRAVRLDWAMERLMSTDEPIARIASAAGFADQSHFTRALRSRTGWTPGTLRRGRR